MIITIDAEKKCIWQNPTSIHNKNSQQTKNMGKLSQLDKEYLQKPVASIIVNGEKLGNFPFRSWTRQGLLLSPFLFNTVSKSHIIQ